MLNRTSAYAYKVLCKLFSVPDNGDTPMELDVYDFKGPGIALAMYNVDEVCFVNYSRQ